MVSSLLAKGKQVVALVRSEEAQMDLSSLGASAVRGDAFEYKVQHASRSDRFMITLDEK